jgi:hypothetical protein
MATAAIAAARELLSGASLKATMTGSQQATKVTTATSARRKARIQLGGSDVLVSTIWMLFEPIPTVCPLRVQERAEIEQWQKARGEAQDDGDRAIESDNRLDDDGDPQRREDDQPVDQPGRKTGREACERPALERLIHAAIISASVANAKPWSRDEHHIATRRQHSGLSASDLRVAGWGSRL